MTNETRTNPIDYMGKRALGKLQQWGLFDGGSLTKKEGVHLRLQTVGEAERNGAVTVLMADRKVGVYSEGQATVVVPEDLSSEDAIQYALSVMDGLKDETLRQGIRGVDLQVDETSAVHTVGSRKKPSQVHLSVVGTVYVSVSKPGAKEGVSELTAKPRRAERNSGHRTGRPAGSVGAIAA